jgi:hypothetical protein
VIRDVFRAKAGKGKELVTKFKTASSFMPKEGVSARRILTDTVAAYWTIVMNTRPSNPKAEEAMKGYADIVEGGYREILHVE